MANPEWEEVPFVIGGESKVVNVARRVHERVVGRNVRSSSRVQHTCNERTSQQATPQNKTNADR